MFLIWLIMIVLSLFWQIENYQYSIKYAPALMLVFGLVLVSLERASQIKSRGDRFLQLLYTLHKFSFLLLFIDVSELGKDYLAAFWPVQTDFTYSFFHILSASTYLIFIRSYTQIHLSKDGIKNYNSDRLDPRTVGIYFKWSLDIILIAIAIVIATTLFQDRGAQGVSVDAKVINGLVALIGIGLIAPTILNYIKEQKNSFLKSEKQYAFVLLAFCISALFYGYAQASNNPSISDIAYSILTQLPLRRGVCF